MPDLYVSYRGYRGDDHVWICEVQYNERILSSLQDLDCLVCYGVNAHFSAIRKSTSEKIRIKIIGGDFRTGDHFPILERILFLDTAVEELCQ
jgi:hypothetical protein